MYSSKESKQMLAEKYHWTDYGNKHEESLFTKWFQSFYLFEKFGIDKRKAHFSSLINSGQLDRKVAMESLQSRPEYPALGLEQRVMKYPKHRHEDFPMDKWFNRVSWIIRGIKGVMEWK